MRNKVVADPAAAVEGVSDGSTVLIGGFGLPGSRSRSSTRCSRRAPGTSRSSATTPANGDFGIARLLANGRVRKVVCSFPRQSDSYVFDELYRAGRVELEVVPQGNLAERIRAGGA